MVSDKIWTIQPKVEYYLKEKQKQETTIKFTRCQ